MCYLITRVDFVAVITDNIKEYYYYIVNITSDTYTIKYYVIIYGIINCNG